MRNLIVILVAVFTLSSCVETPQEVREFNNTLIENATHFPGFTLEEHNGKVFVLLENPVITDSELTSKIIRSFDSLPQIDLSNTKRNRQIKKAVLSIYCNSGVPIEYLDEKAKETSSYLGLKKTLTWKTKIYGDLPSFEPREYTVTSLNGWYIFWQIIFCIGAPFLISKVIEFTYRKRSIFFQHVSCRRRRAGKYLLVFISFPAVFSLMYSMIITDNFLTYILSFLISILVGAIPDMIPERWAKILNWKASKNK